MRGALVARCLLIPALLMAGPADDLKDKVREFAHGAPIIQIGDMMAGFGQKVRDTYDKAKAKASEMVDSAEHAMGMAHTPEPAAPAATPQGTTKGTAPKTQRKRLRQIKVTPSANGGYIARHAYRQEYGGTPSADTHTFSDYDAMQAHVASHRKSAPDADVQIAGE